MLLLLFQQGRQGADARPQSRRVCPRGVVPRGRGALCRRGGFAMNVAAALSVLQRSVGRESCMWMCRLGCPRSRRHGIASVIAARRRRGGASSHHQARRPWLQVSPWPAPAYYTRGHHRVEPFVVVVPHGLPPKRSLRLFCSMVCRDRWSHCRSLVLGWEHTSLIIDE
jgi:hypothetical protein